MFKGSNSIVDVDARTPMACIASVGLSRGARRGHVNASSCGGKAALPGSGLKHTQSSTRNACDGRLNLRAKPCSVLLWTHRCWWQVNDA